MVEHRVCHWRSESPSLEFRVQVSLYVFASWGCDADCCRQHLATLSGCIRVVLVQLKLRSQ